MVPRLVRLREDADSSSRAQFELATAIGPAAAAALPRLLALRGDDDEPFDPRHLDAAILAVRAPGS